MQVMQENVQRKLFVSKILPITMTSEAKIHLAATSQIRSSWQSSAVDT